MGLDYSINMWVPREALYDFFSELTLMDGSDELKPLIWPDGKRLALSPHRVKHLDVPERDLVPVGPSIESDSSFCLSFPFKVDEELRRYTQERQNEFESKNWEPELIPKISEDGFYSVGCIWTYVGLSADRFKWVKDESIWTRVTFAAATTRISYLFDESESIRNFFVDLARKSGAIYCTLDKEINGVEVLFVSAEGRNLPLGWISGYMREPEIGPHISASDAELVQNISFCVNLEPPLSEAEIERVISFTHEAEAGLRARAYRALKNVEVSAALPLLELGLSDDDWRVRAIVAYTIGELRVPLQFERWPDSAQPLIEALHDSHPEVRTTAAGQLRYFDDPVVFQAQLELFENTKISPENLGLLKQVLHGLWMNKAGWNAASFVEKRMLEPNFPFPNEAKRAIEILRTREERPV